MIDEHPAHDRYTLRAATESDRGFVLALWRESLGPYVAPLFGQWDDAAAGRNFAAKLSARLQIILVEGQAAGVFHLCGEDDCLNLKEIELIPKFRNQGLGSQIINDVNTYADTHALGVELQVLATNPARQWYARMGFGATHFKMYRKAQT